MSLMYCFLRQEFLLGCANSEEWFAVLQLLAKWCGSGGVDSENDDDDGHEPLVETMTKSGLSPLMLACGEGLINVAYYLLTSMHAEPDSQNTTGYAPLHAAARGGHDAVVSLMLEQGADLSIEDENGWTSLHFAAKEGHVSTCSMMRLMTKSCHSETCNKLIQLIEFFQKRVPCQGNRTRELWEKCLSANF